MSSANAEELISMGCMCFIYILFDICLSHSASPPMKEMFKHKKDLCIYRVKFDVM